MGKWPKSKWTTSWNMAFYTTNNESLDVTDTLIEIWPFMPLLIDYWISLTRWEQIQTEGFEAVESAVKDLILVTEITFLELYCRGTYAISKIIPNC